MFVADMFHLALLTCCMITSSSAFISWLFGGGGAGDHQMADVDGKSASSVAHLRASVPFEMKISDDNFLLEAQIKGLSQLDVCHHQVIAALKSTCGQLSEEGLGKLAVQLLNCQSVSEKRQTYPCTKDMTIADCTKDMDPTTWNAYQIVSNRARAICYSTRQQQFRSKTEHTVNRLIDTTEAQLYSMKHLLQGQTKIKALADQTLSQIETSQEQLLSRQQAMKSRQRDIQAHILGNLKELSREKALIAMGNKELAEMTEQIKQKLEKVVEQLEDQESEQRRSHAAVLRDLAVVRAKARDVWHKIDISSQHLLHFHKETSQQYQETLQGLRRLNETVSNIVQLMDSMQDKMDQKLDWLSSLVGGTGDRVALVYTSVTHVIYFLLAATSAAFLHTPMFSRLVMLLLVPLNAVSEIRQARSLGFTAMTMFILLTVFANWAVSILSSICWRKKRWTYETDKQTISLPSGSRGEMRDGSGRSQPEPESLHPNNPEFKRLVDVLEKLYQAGYLSPEILLKTANCQESPDTGLHSTDYTQRVAKVPDPGPLSLPHVIQPHVCLASADTTQTRVDQVKRDLLESLGSNCATSEHNQRASRLGRVERVVCEEMEEKDSGKNIARSGRGLDTTPGGGSGTARRRSRSSTPNRQLCKGRTKAGFPCRMTCTDESQFCHRHQDHMTGERLTS